MPDDWRATIRFGDPDDPELSDTETFSFETKAELDAFFQGIYAMDGWYSATVLEDSRHPKGGSDAD